MIIHSNQLTKSERKRIQQELLDDVVFTYKLVRPKLNAPTETEELLDDILKGIR
jgi:hypothetical protein